MHIYESTYQGASQKETYLVDEYGAKPDVVYSRRAGSLDQALDAMHQASFAFAVVANLFFTESTADDYILEKSPGALTGGIARHNRYDALVRLREYNKWLCDASRKHPSLIPLVSVDPWVMSSSEMVVHLHEMVRDFGARGVKLHPNAQRVSADDQRLWPVYELCSQLQIPVLAHSGASPHNSYSEPRTFARALREFPHLRLVLAHLGGATWSQTKEIATTFPNVMFDCSEIIAWTGAPNAPNDGELAKLIIEVGADRVLLGTDFPWYDLDRTAAQVQALPLLSLEQKDLILGVNAARLFSLPIDSGLHS